MRPNFGPWRGVRIAAFVLVTAMTGRAGAATLPAPSASPRDSSRLRAECEYGIALALAGADARAESAFVSLLSHAPGDPRALNNLGNTHLLRGALDVALAFYQQASEADTSDPGIVLNGATALMLRGDEEEAQSLAAEGVRRAGGVRQAALLLGLKAPESSSDAPKAGDRAYLRKDEVLALLRAAAAQEFSAERLSHRVVPDRWLVVAEPILGRHRLFPCLDGARLFVSGRGDAGLEDGGRDLEDVPAQVQIKHGVGGDGEWSGDGGRRGRRGRTAAAW